MIKFQKEHIMECKDEIETNYDAHQSDISVRTSLKLKIDWDTYSGMEDIGNLCFVTTRDEEKLIGYAAFLLHTHIHHKVVYAIAATLFIRPDYRGNRIAERMLQASETILKRLNVHTMACSVVKNVDYSAMLEREGFTLLERIYGKEL